MNIRTVRRFQQKVARFSFESTRLNRGLTFRRAKHERLFYPKLFVGEMPWRDCEEKRGLDRVSEGRIGQSVRRMRTCFARAASCVIGRREENEPGRRRDSSRISLTLFSLTTPISSRICLPCTPASLSLSHIRTRAFARAREFSSCQARAWIYGSPRIAISLTLRNVSRK